jgi:hypothetical protein
MTNECHYQIWWISWICIHGRHGPELCYIMVQVRPTLI